jgi:peptide/nickel transport system substrate-binding protein
MTTLTRRAMLRTAAAAAVAPLPALAQPAIARPSRAGTLRIVPGSSLTALDPIWTPAGVTTGHAYHVFDTLFAVDRALVARPQMAEGLETSDDGRTCTIRLRPGLLFHDGTPVLARDAIASIRRWSRRDAFGSLLGRAMDNMQALDDRTLRISFTRPFRRVADALAHPVANACFVMPERLAATDPLKQVTEMVGSGPYRFLADEFVAGSAVAYARFDGYLPRAEPADYASGGKRAGFARIEWHIIPDAATAAAALQTGEVDWWEVAQPDLVPALARNPQVKVANADPFFAALRFNCSQPPFDNAKLRHAVLTAIDQTDYMGAIASGDEHAWRTCYAMMGCGLPHVRETGAALMTPPRDLAAARKAVADAGYNGEKVVILSPTDLPAIGPHGEITADLLRRLGMNVDLQTMDWGSVGQRRVSREPVSRNGWSIFHINTPGIAIANPALDFFIRGQGANGFFGWFDSPEMERIAADWLDSTSEAQDDALFDAAQTLAFAQAPIVPLGMFDVRTAYRADLAGVIPASVLYPWNVRRAG